MTTSASLRSGAPATPQRLAASVPALPHRPGAIALHLAITFGIMGVVGLVLAVFDVTEAHPAYGALYAIGLLSPFVGALAHSWAATGSLRPIRDLYWPVRLGPGAWMIAALPLSVAAAYGLAGAGGLLPLDAERLPSPGSLLFAMLVWSSVMWAEETSWRGVLLPVLQQRHGPLRATLLVAAAWALWHVPLLAVLGMPASGYGWFTAQCLGASLVMTWAWNRSGNALVPVLIHGANNAVMVALVEAVPGYTANDLMGVQTLGPLALGLSLAVATRGRLGYPAASGKGER